MPSTDDETDYSVFDDEQRVDRDRSAEADPHAAEATRAEDRSDSLGTEDDSGCPKCGSEGTETDEIATSGTGLTKLFDVQNRKFVVVSCANCGYSELYKGQSTGNAIDFFIG